MTVVSPEEGDANIRPTGLKNENWIFHGESSREAREAARPVAFDAVEQIGFPGKIFLHREGAAAGALIRLQPSIDWLVRHLRVGIAQSFARRLPSRVATGEHAHRKSRKP